ncbi:hypothetical protein RHGRI_035924 [Rhododendron griersonianum]|uniref:Uncharacterized protein n=1 Tax=Rhododendron griersonianum TaxID=479676 RepID=A0AAV6HQ43_9ERIC|nr:hypothetical protein RHGRI_035924 [Rhododendron griersonianum]
MSASGVVVHAERPYHVDEPGEVLQQLQLQSIASSSEIRDALKDEELQKLICNIDCSPDAVNVSAGELFTGDITLFYPPLVHISELL